MHGIVALWWGEGIDVPVRPERHNAAAPRQVSCYILIDTVQQNRRGPPADVR